MSNYSGLTEKEVNDRIINGQVNIDVDVNTKTIPQILINNTCTIFNLLNACLGLLIIIVGSYKNLLFLGVVVFNTLISSIQEIRSKKTVDKLSLIVAIKVAVIRDGKEKQIDTNKVVIDDLIILNIENQVVVDSIIVKGSVEVNESLITGEADPVTKKKGDMLLSGSYIVGGDCFAKVVHVGEDNYSYTISKEAKYIKKINSVIMSSLNKIIKIISFIIIPLGILLFCNQYLIANSSFSNAIINTVAALIAMIPEGLVLLTSTVLAVSVIRLSKSNVLVQELYCIETLARVDTICFDKTGTLTEGIMEVTDFIDLSSQTYDVEKIMGELCNNLSTSNQTMKAINDYYGLSDEWNADIIIPFSSEKKWSGVTFKEQGSYIIGAPEILIKTKTMLKAVEDYSKYGRVLLLAYSKLSLDSKNIPLGLKPVGLILIQDKIRKESLKTINYFKKQGVDIKIISGDSANTVMSVAKRLSLSDVDYIDTTNMTEEEVKKCCSKYSVFGRVTPEIKKVIIKQLKQLGHTVAMTGDGVNDVLALKEADCSIALSCGSDAARNVSQLVLLDSNFDSMPAIVEEGRRTVNNIERSASLFIIKTIYASLLAVIFVFVPIKYPFIPIQLTLTSSLTIGIPSFILALEPNKNIIKGNFFINIIKAAFPTALTIVINIIIVLVLGKLLSLTNEQISTLSVILTGFAGFVHIYRICVPFNKLRLVMIIFLISIFIFGIIGFRTFFSLSFLNIKMFIILAILIANTIIIINLMTMLFDKYVYKYIKKIA